MFEIALTPTSQTSFSNFIIKPKPNIKLATDKLVITTFW